MNDEEMEKTLRALRDRPGVPKERREAAFERVRAEWQAGLASRESGRNAAPRRRWMLAAAASVLIVAFSGLSLWVYRDSPPRVVVATVTAVHGDGSLRVDDLVHAEQRIKSGATTLSMTLASGLVVRVAPDSALTFIEADRFELERGRIFIDSNPARSKDPLLVKTALGEVSHVGTRYFVEYDQKRLSVAVREGMIALQQADDFRSRATATAGEQLNLSSSRPERVERTTVSAADTRWRWIEMVPSPLDIDGLSLGVFLEWYEQETGRRVTLRDASPETTLSGNIAGLSPDDALDAIALAVELDVNRGSESVVIGKR
ncbi:MAG: hypothetical protein FJ196_06460 [Gammaproteobacteria bacterium]|nr:hypothetical protein [Gammaproteobacteria bacterium]